VPYDFDQNTTPEDRAAIRQSMDALEAVAAVRFVSRSVQTNYLHIADSDSNNSQVGMTGGSQPVNIYNWDYEFIMCHELMHALGVWHEQSRPDRDQFVIVNLENVSNDGCGGPCDHNFDVVQAATQGGYDFDSVMHYRADAFSGNGQPTIVCRSPYQDWQTLIGQRTHLSTGDQQGLVSRYGPPLAQQFQITDRQGTLRAFAWRQQTEESLGLSDGSTTRGAVSVAVSACPCLHDSCCACSQSGTAGYLMTAALQPNLLAWNARVWAESDAPTVCTCWITRPASVSVTNQVTDSVRFSVAQATQVVISYDMHSHGTMAGDGPVWYLDTNPTQDARIIDGGIARTYIHADGVGVNQDVNGSYAVTLLPGVFRMNFTIAGGSPNGSLQQQMSINLAMRVQSAEPVVQPPAEGCGVQRANLIVPNPESGAYQWQWRPNDAAGWLDLFDGDNSAAGAPAFTVRGTGTIAVALAGPGAQAAPYRCHFTDSCHTETDSGEAGVWFPENSLSIVEEPQPQSICGSGTAHFYLDTDGVGPGFQWQAQSGNGWVNLIDGANVLVGNAFHASISGASTPSLALAALGRQGPAMTNRFLIRCIAFNACGRAVSNNAELTINSADMNGDGDVGTDADIEAFFACLAGDCCATCGSADFNGDGDTGTVADVESFFRVLGGGSC
jgi:hypothetical protein